MLCNAAIQIFGLADISLTCGFAHEHIDVIGPGIVEAPRVERFCLLLGWLPGLPIPIRHRVVLNVIDCFK